MKKSEPYQPGKTVTVTKGKWTIVTDFVTIDGNPVKAPTTAGILWDDDGLAIRFDCADSHITAQHRQPNDPNLWLDDCVEVYLDIGHRHDAASPWVHAIASAAGCLYEQQNRNTEFHIPGFQVSAERTEGGWRAEMRLPWRGLGVTPAPGAVWGFNLNRNDYPEKERQCFAPTYGGFNSVHRWGHLIFADALGAAPGAEAALASSHKRLDEEAAENERNEAITRLPFPDIKPLTKTGSVFYSANDVEFLRRNFSEQPWGRNIRQAVVGRAKPWLDKSDDELWSLMFGNTINRAWDVWKDGFCPSCKKRVTMYNWVINAHERPWKAQCPCCKDFFPKNDFYAFYRSALDERGVFDPARGDRSLLFNAEHPEEGDPLREFGVDDGEGYVQNGNRWRFIGAYLVYGQWKQMILGGIEALAAAYVVAGRPAYARKAAVLLDRVADLYPTFDFSAQGLVYGNRRSNGYVSMWHDACEETRLLALAYDQIFDAVRDSAALVKFLRGKAVKHKLENRKETFLEIQRNIEERILCDAMRNYDKIHSNYPRAAVTQCVIKTVLDWPRDRDAIMSHIDHIIARATRVDGLTGEKGFTGYTVYTIRGLADFLAEFARIDGGFLPELFARHPKLRKTWRVHIDARCLDRYYPQVGDCGWFAATHGDYAAAIFRRIEEAHGRGALGASMYGFFWELYQITGDPAYVQILYEANDNRTDGLPHDVWCPDPKAFQEKVGSVIAEHGPAPALQSVNFEEWCLAVLRSGRGANARAVWLDYDTGGSHGHIDGMNLGFFACGLDLMPDFGYYPLQFGEDKVEWYQSTAAHNTVVVDGQNQKGHHWSHRYDDMRRGRTTLWCPGKTAQVIRVSAPEMIDGLQYERVIAVIDISPESFYVFDVFRVVGGRDHVKSVGGHFGKIRAHGLTLQPAEGYSSGPSLPLRDIRRDPAPAPGWYVDWRIEDRYKLLPADADLYMRYSDLTRDAEAAVCEAWVVPGNFNVLEEAWVPRVLVRRRRADAALCSSFASIYEPYRKQPAITRIRRLDPVSAEGGKLGAEHVALELELRDGRRDLLVSVDAENPSAAQPDWRKSRKLLVNDWNLTFEGEFLWARLDQDGNPMQLLIGAGRRAQIGRTVVELAGASSTAEVSLHSSRSA